MDHCLQIISEQIPQIMFHHVFSHGIHLPYRQMLLQHRHDNLCCLLIEHDILLLSLFNSLKILLREKEIHICLLKI